MEYRNCDKCGRLFQVTYCEECANEENDDFTLVKDFIASHAGQNLFDVSRATGVSRSKILGYINMGRLSIQNAGSIEDAKKKPDKK